MSKITRPDILLSERHCLRLVEVRAADQVSGVYAEYELRRGCHRDLDGDWCGGERLPVDLPPHHYDPERGWIGHPEAQALAYCKALGYVTGRTELRQLVGADPQFLPLAIDLESWRADDRPGLALAPEG